MSKTEYMRAWRAKHPEHRDYMRQWRETHAEQLKAYRQRYYEEHAEREIDLAVIWQKAHLVEAAIHRKIAAAHERYPGRITAQDIRDLVARVGWVCCWCKKAITSLRDFTLEHLEPVNDPKHLAIACAACNAAKVPSSGLARRLTLEERQERVRAARRKSGDDWRNEHREQSNANQRARYHANIEERRAYFREWQRKKRERDSSPRPIRAESAPVRGD